MKKSALKLHRVLLYFAIYYCLGAMFLVTCTSSKKDTNTLFTDGGSHINGVAIETEATGGGTETEDEDSPIVLNTTPDNNTTEVSIKTTISALFDVEMANATITENSFTLHSHGEIVPGTIHYDTTSKTATLTPINNLSCNTVYTATLSSSVSDLHRKGLKDNLSWIFNTGSRDVECAIVSFITFGDWGAGEEYGTTYQFDVADAIYDYCRNQNCDFIVTLGDNFYPSGVTDIYDPQWKGKYQDVYEKLGLPFYAALGWHDQTAGGSIQAQIDFSEVDDSWHMPAEYYSFMSPTDTSNALIEFFVLNSGDFLYQEDEKLWLQNAIANSSAIWKVLVTYVPLISNGSHGNDALGIGKDLIPTICGKIDVIVSGHDHIFSHLTETIDGCYIDQLILGTGGGSSQVPDFTDERVLFSDSPLYGFGWFQVVYDEIVFRMIDRQGTTPYETTWKK